MDRFRFRAWDNDAGTFTYSFVEDENYIWGFQDGKLTAWAIVMDSGTIDEPPQPTSVELEPPEQSTGLKDKNGKLIFEGDILCIDGGGKLKPYPTVIFEDGCFGIRWAEDRNLAELKHYVNMKFCTVEIIGNIYETDISS